MSKTLTADYNSNRAALDSVLRVSESFDVLTREILLGQKHVCVYFLDGLTKEVVATSILAFWLQKKPEDIANFPADDARGFAERFIPHAESRLSDDVAVLSRAVLSGQAVCLAEGIPQAIVVDIRAYPERGVTEPENDKVLTGPHEGFVESILQNTALLRRRIRDSQLTMRRLQIGEESKTDVVVCFVSGTAEQDEVERLCERLKAIRTKSLTMGQQALLEQLVPKQRWNPFPKVRYTERPDAAAASLLEGRILIMTDNVPNVMIVPTGFLDFIQNTNDYYFPPIVGTYLRWVRLMLFALTVLLPPVWLLINQYPDILPEPLRFVILQKSLSLPVFVQFLIVELLIDALRLASLNTPSSLGNAFAVVSALVLGESAVQAGWFHAEVVLYMAFVAIANFAQPSFELGYAFKLCRIFLLVATALGRVWGFTAALLLELLLLAFTKTVSGRSYLYPLAPFNGKALSALLFQHAGRRDKQ
ncbi:MAG: spore germination protein [Oscillospiraceae bacterium]|jgi:stage V sporulation protein AF|nr:spore germination protein [Oscillospiraceae bacterium]